MNSWWDLGEGSGHLGSELDVYRITCPFCFERGKFALEHRATKKKPNSSKSLNFDTLKCASCAGYVMVLWSASEYGSGVHGLYDYRVLPWPMRIDKSPEHWPEDVGRFWLQAHRSATEENWDAAAIMTRSSLQAALRRHQAEGKSLKHEIDDLASKGVLPPHMKAWAHELRELGNDAAHPEGQSEKPSPQDVRDALRFLDFLLEYLFSLPHEIERYRGRKGASSA